MLRKCAKKTIIIAICVASILLTMLILFGSLTRTYENRLSQDISSVDEQIQELIKSDAYKNGTISERKKLVGEQLHQLAYDGYISHLLYDKQNALFSFQYADASLGGIQLTDFDYQFNSLPIN